MELLDTIKDFFAMLYFIFSSLPKEFQIGIIVVFVLAIIMTFGLSSACDKKKNVKNKEKKSEENKEKEYQSMNSPEKLILKQEDEELDDLKDLSFSAKTDEDLDEISEDYFSENKKLPSMKKKVMVKEESLENVIVEDVKEIEFVNKFYENIQLDNFHKVDKIYVNNKGVFLLFSIPLNAKTVYGDEEDEFLFLDGNQSANPLSQKSGYIKKINKWLQINTEKISIVIISEDIEFAQSSLPIYKNVENFEKILNVKENIMTKDELTRVMKSNLLN